MLSKILNNIAPSLEIDIVLSFLSLPLLLEINERIPVSHTSSITTSAPFYDESATAPVFNELPKFELVHGVIKLVYFCNS